MPYILHRRKDSPTVSLVISIVCVDIDVMCIAFEVLAEAIGVSTDEGMAHIKSSEAGV
jgi:hypothetical protein